MKSRNPDGQRFASGRARHQGGEFAEIVEDQEVEAASEAKDHFLAVLSHELRTPLTPIIMALDSMARRVDLPAPVQRAHAMIERNVKREAHFIDDH